MKNRRKLRVLLIFLFILFASIYVYAGQVHTAKITTGDADRNNTVNKEDAKIILQKIAAEKNGGTFEREIPSKADTNSDSNIDLLDVVNIARYTKANDGEIDREEWINNLEQDVQFGIVEDEIKIDLSKNNTKTVTVQGENFGKVTYSVENQGIAQVDSNGNITGKANGETLLRVTEDKGNITATCKIIVETSTTSLQLSSSEIYLDLGNTSKIITAIQSPSTVSLKGVTWTSSNTNVVTVNNGEIVRVGTGEATITAKTIDGSNKTATCRVKVKEEKIIFCGPSTVTRLEGVATISGTEGDLWGIDYFDEFGFTIKATEAQAGEGGAYENITNSTNNTDADLFFVARGASGLRYFAGENFNGKSVSQLNLDNEECFASVETGKGGQELEELLMQGNQNNWHFTVAFICSGNDLTKKNMSAEIINNIAKLNADYCSYLANKYPNHTFCVFPITPIDEPNAAQNSPLRTHSYTVTNSNNLKRYRFSMALNDAIKDKSIKNLKYDEEMFLYLLRNSAYVGNFGGVTCTGDLVYTKLNGKNSTTAAYKTYDGKHYAKWGCRIVMEQVLISCGVVDNAGIKLK